MSQLFKSPLLCTVTSVYKINNDIFPVPQHLTSAKYSFESATILKVNYTVVIGIYSTR